MAGQNQLQYNISYTSNAKVLNSSVG